MGLHQLLVFSGKQGVVGTEIAHLARKALLNLPHLTLLLALEILGQNPALIV